jgi:putative restriction endonuclease
MVRRREIWNRDELVVAFNLYCRIPFGRIHKGNPNIIEVARALKRTPSALAMKMVNFASLDPAQKKRNVRGLRHGSKQDQVIWEEFTGNWTTLAEDSERILREKLAVSLNIIEPEKIAERTVATEGIRVVRIRLVQRFFREAVLASYGYCCTVCNLGLVAMLNASHIIPWAVDAKRRADPRNGLALCAFHDRAFDKGLMTIDENLRVVIAREAKVADPPKLHKVGLLEMEGKAIYEPERFSPDGEALAYHRENVFVG